MLRVLILLLLVAGAVFGSTSDARQSEKKGTPNIIYIYADDLGYGELGCYGQQKIKTPHLDKLASEGIRFTQHYSSAPVCAPSRCMLLTGKHAGHAYIRGNYELGGFSDQQEGGQMPLPEGTFTVAHMLKKTGYTTAVIGKWGLGMQNTTGAPTKQGFDYSYGYLCQKQSHNFYPTHLWENGKRDALNNPVIEVHKKIDPATAGDKDFDYFTGSDYAVDRMTDKALKFIDANRKKPFFLYLTYTLPHLSLQIPEKYRQPYAGAFSESPYYGEKGYAATKYPRSTYAAMITYLDQQVGIILEQIKKAGLDENTLIMFSSDNGATFNSCVDVGFFNSVAGLRGLKMDLYEGGIRVPFIARWPGKIQPGKVTDHVSVQFDLMATLAELTGQSLTETDGISFLPTLLGKGVQRQHPYLYFEFSEKGGQVAVRQGDWKGVKNIKDKVSMPWEIYDLRKDPHEADNVAVQHPELAAAFDAIVKEAHQPSHIREWEFIDPKF